MNWLQALILGIIQGLTEFLPVSSSGHLEIGQALLGTSGEDNLTFAIIVHTATVLSTLVVLWNEVVWLLRGTFTTVKWNAEKDYAAKILLSMVPVFVVGMFFKDEVEVLFGNGLLLVGICLLVTALLLALNPIAQRQQQGCDEPTGVCRSTGSEPFRFHYCYGTAVWCEEGECSAVFIPDGADSYSGRSVSGCAETAQRRGGKRSGCTACRGRVCSSIRDGMSGLQIHAGDRASPAIGVVCCLLCHCRNSSYCHNIDVSYAGFC